MSVISVPSSPYRRAFGDSPVQLPRLNTSQTARQSPTIIAGPSSPTKSIRADFMRTSQNSTKSAAPSDGDVIQSSMDVVDFSPTPSARKLKEQLTLEEREKHAARESADSKLYEEAMNGQKERYAARHSAHSFSFFDVDSSEVSGVSHDQVRSSNEEESEVRPAARSGREDSMSTVRAPHNTRLNSKASNISKASNLTDSQIERYMTNAYITTSEESKSFTPADFQDTPNKEATPHTLADFQTPAKEIATYTLADFQENTPLTTDERKFRPISDLSFGNHSLKLPQNRLSGTTNTSTPASVSGDRVIATYSTLSGLMQEAGQQSGPDELAYSQQAAILPTNEVKQHNVRSSPLNPLAASFRAANTPSAFHSFSSPLGPSNAKRNSRHVSLRPPPLKPTSLHSNFVAPAEYTPYPTITGLNNRHSFKLQTRHDGWERLGDRSPRETPDIPNSIHNARLPVVLRRRHTSRTAHIVLPSAFNSNGTDTNAIPRPGGQAAAASQTSFHSRLSTPASPVFDPNAPGPATAELASLHFDDEDLFLALRHAYYADLLGKSALSRFVRRYLAARTLAAVRYVPDPLAVGLGMGLGVGMDMGMGLGLGIEELPAPHEGELMKRWCKPDSGKGSFEVVRWAWSVACAAGVASAGNRDVFQAQQQHSSQNQHQQQAPATKQSTTIHVSPAPPSDSDTLYPPNPTFPFPFLYPTSSPTSTSTPARGHIQFEEGWAIWRIVAAVCAVLTAAMAMVLIWTFVGVGGGGAGEVGSIGGEGGRGGSGGDVGDAARVQEAFVMGLVVLVIGMCQVLAWLGISWVVM